MRRLFRTGTTLSDLNRGARFGRSAAAGESVGSAPTQGSGPGIGRISAIDILMASIRTALIEDAAITNAKIESLDAAKITAGILATTRLDLALVLVHGATWNDNSPSAGRVAWSGATVYHRGNAYVITNGDTANKYIWWSSTTSNTTFQSSDTRPTLGDAEFLIATNNAGVHDLAWNAPSNSGVFPTHLSFESMASLFIYGDGIDGDVTISGNTTLTRDMAYNNLTVNNGVVLTTNGYRVFVKNTLLNNGTIRHNGNSAPDNGGGGGIAGTGAPAGNMGGGSNGGPGSTAGGAAGGNGFTLTNGLGAVGGSGGAGSTAGGAGGTRNTTRANRHGLMLLGDTAEIRGGTGGGGGGSGAGDFDGGGGGGGGGVIIIAARVITNNGTIEAKGGNGSNAQVGNIAGGGGGGGGGAVVLVYRSITIGTIDVGGGAFGTGGSGGANGITGGAGLQLLIQQEA